MLLIGITGKAGAGKDTVGQSLKIHHDFAVLSFAHPIKAAISAMLDVNPELWNDRFWKEDPIPTLGHRTPRYMAQTLGTEWGRSLIDNSMWITLTEKRIDFMGWERVAITDVRFENEARMIRGKGILIHIHRDIKERIDNVTHASEAGIVPYESDLHIYNTGTIAEIDYKVQSIMNTIFKRLRKSA